MSFDEIFDLTAGVYFNFYNIYIIWLARPQLHYLIIPSSIFAHVNFPVAFPLARRNLDPRSQQYRPTNKKLPNKKMTFTWADDKKNEHKNRAQGRAAHQPYTIIYARGCSGVVLQQIYEGKSFYGRVVKTDPSRISLKTVSLATPTSPFDSTL